MMYLQAHLCAVCGTAQGSTNAAAGGCSKMCGGAGMCSVRAAVLSNPSHVGAVLQPPLLSSASQLSSSRSQLLLVLHKARPMQQHLYKAGGCSKMCGKAITRSVGAAVSDVSPGTSVLCLWYCTRLDQCSSTWREETARCVEEQERAVLEQQ
jgi:hypothetical protein